MTKKRGVLQRSVFVVSLLLVLISVLSVGAALTAIFRQSHLAAMEDSLRDQAVLFSRSVGPAFGLTAEEALNRRIGVLKRGLSARVTVVNVDGDVIGDSQARASLLDYDTPGPEIREALRGKTAVSREPVPGPNGSALYVAVPVRYRGEIVGAVRFEKALRQVDELVVRMYGALALGAAVVAVILAGLGYPLFLRLERPLQALSASARQLAAGDYTLQVKGVGNDEISELAGAFNDMGRTVAVSIEQLREEKLRIEAILFNLEEGVIVTDGAGAVISANRAAERMFGFRLEQVVGKPAIAALIAHGVDEGVLRALSLGEPTEAEVCVVWPAERILGMYSVPISGADGGITGTLVVFQDISKLKRLEHVRQDFVANVSHELRTPIASVKAMAETLIGGAIEDAEVAQRFLTTIDREADRLARLVDDLLQLSKIEARELPLRAEEFDLGELIDETLLQLESKGKAMGVSLVRQVEGCPRLMAHRDNVQQVLVNLIDNAVTHAGRGSTVGVEARNTEEGTTVIAVADNGVGISDRDLQRIFERFYRVDRARSRQLGGTGLGLSIVKHIVDAHGGTIHVESEEGSGSRFEVVLPTMTEV